MLRTAGLGAGILAITLFVSFIVAASCSRFWTGTLAVQNESRTPVELHAGTYREVTVDAGDSRTIKLGLFWGRWGTPGSVRIGNKECLWSELKAREPLVVTDDGPLCDDIYSDLPGGFDP